MVEYMIARRLNFYVPRIRLFSDWWKTAWPFNRFFTHATLHLRNGLSFKVRGTNSSDVQILLAIFNGNEYPLNWVRLPYNPVVVDLGANIGAFSAYVKHLYPYARVIAYEPLPDSFLLLKKNCPSIETHEYAITSKNGEATFYPNDFPASATLVRSGVCPDIKQPNSITVQTRSLEDALAGIGHIDLLKIDIESAEHDAILNSSKDVFKNVQNIFIELHDANGQFDNEKLARYIQGLGFIIKKQNNVNYWFIKK
jgi:FkbM family methyltransferase